MHLPRQEAMPPGPPAPPPMVGLSANPIPAAVSIVVIMVIVVGSKLSFRKFKMHKFGWDDAMALIGMLFVIAVCAVITSVFKEAGLDSASARASVGQIGKPGFEDRLFIFALLGSVPNGFAKLSILILLLNVFPRTVRPLSSIFVFAGIATTVLFYSIQILYFGIHCGPYKEPCSIDTQNNLGKACASINLVLDLYILAVAVVNVWTMQLNLREKLGVTLVFGLGVLAIVCSIITIYYRSKLISDPNAAWFHVLTPLVLVVYEPSIALMAASLPSYPSLFRWLHNTPMFTSVRSLLTRAARGNSTSDVECIEPSSQELISTLYEKTQSGQVGRVQVQQSHAAETEKK